jgi:N6-adenosine-specific RNA methylase IME4
MKEPWPFGYLRPLHYRVILIDSPWRFFNYSAKGEKKNPVARYDCMPLGEIMALPVSQLATPDCVLISWATAPMLPQAIEAMQQWGFVFKSAGAWAKQSSTGNAWSFGTGYVYRSAAEFWLMGTIGRPKQKARNVRNLIVSPVRAHSQKPEQMYEDIEKLWDGPFVELFARATRPNWSSWGNQVGKLDAA